MRMQRENVNSSLWNDQNPTDKLSEIQAENEVMKKQLQSLQAENEAMKKQLQVILNQINKKK